MKKLCRRKKAGVKLGAYVYIYSKTAAAATKGAEWVLKQIKGKTFELPIYCDMEDPTIAGLGKTKLTAITDAFNAAIKKGGYRVGIYASLDWFRNKLNSTVKNTTLGLRTTHQAPTNTRVNIRCGRTAARARLTV